MMFNSTLPTLKEHSVFSNRNNNNNLQQQQQQQIPTSLHRPFVRKTVEELEYDYITSLIQDRDFHQPTISYLAKSNQIKLPILCDKCLESVTNNDNYLTDENGEVICEHFDDEEILKPVVGNYITYLTPCGTCEYNKKLCLLYNNRKQSASTSNTPINSYSPILLNRRNVSALRDKHSQSAPLEKTNKIYDSDSDYSDKSMRKKKVKIVDRLETETSKNLSVSSTNKNSTLKKTSNIKSNQNRNNNNNNNKANEDAPMIEGDIRYKFTKSGLEVKRLNSKNSLIIDIFTQEVCKDQTEKSYSEWLNKQREDENRKNQKYPSQIYEKQLKVLLANFKKGPLTYEVWARQNYEILLLKDKIKRAKKVEDAEKREKLNKAKEQESLNAFQLWKINKEFAKYNKK